MSILKRKMTGWRVSDPSSIDNMTFSEKAGARKSTEVGRHLIPIPISSGGALTWTTNVTTVTPLPAPGKNLAVYNNSGTVGAITFGMADTITALASGAVDSSGNVGLPCQPNSWSYFAAGESSWVIATAATLLVFLIDDDTAITIEAQNLSSNGFTT